MRLFLSHASEDKAFVERLASRLQDLEVSVWYDMLEVGVGDFILDKIESGLHTSDHVLVVLSKHSALSEWVKREWSYALFQEITKKRVILLPARLDDSAPPPMLLGKAFADFRRDFEEGFRQLIAMIQPQTSFATIGDPVGLTLDRVEFLHSVDSSRVCFEVRAINSSDMAIWIKLTRLSARVRTEGNGHHFFHHKIVHRVMMPCSIEADASVGEEANERLFRGVLFEDCEDRVGYNWSGKFKYNETGNRSWHISLDMPTYFCFPAHGSMHCASFWTNLRAICCFRKLPAETLLAVRHPLRIAWR